MNSDSAARQVPWPSAAAASNGPRSASWDSAASRGRRLAASLTSDRVACKNYDWGCWRRFTATDVPDHSVIKGEGDPLEPPATLAQTFHRLIKAAILSGWPG